MTVNGNIVNAGDNATQALNQENYQNIQWTNISTNLSSINNKSNHISIGIYAILHALISKNLTAPKF